MPPRRQVLYLSMLAEPGSNERAGCSATAAGCDDSVWLGDRIAELGLADSWAVRAVDVAANQPLPPVDADFDACVLGGTFRISLDWEFLVK